MLKKIMLKVSILDGYVDEPTCLGVPPYISPYPRYIAGAIWHFDRHAQIFYVTIDQVRNNKNLSKKLAESNLIIVIAGVTVPGRYLSGFPVSPYELKNILKDTQGSLKILCGPAARHGGFGLSGGEKIRETKLLFNDLFDLFVEGDGETVVYDLLKNNLNVEKTDPTLCRSDAHAVQKFAAIGSKVVSQHPFFPNYLICEIETYRGCPRSIVGGCSFCSEPSRGRPDFRPIEDVLEEIKALYRNGVRHFRIGSQPCIFSYMAKEADRNEFPKPNTEALEKLFKGIRCIAPNLETLHIDNANPGVLARYPQECREIAKIIIRYHTPGDVAALGVESVDPIVVKKNNLKASAEEVFSAIKLLNEVGANRGYNGLPELLPGLNFVFGLYGETKKTFELNYEFLKKILETGLLLRRINLRQLIPIPGTKMFKIGNKIVRRNKKMFHSFKRKVREEIEQTMLRRIAPQGVVLKNVFTETYRGKTTFGRQIGSYPLLVGIPGVFPLHQFIDVKVVDHGYRSVTAIPYPLDINKASLETIENIPGIGKKRATRIIVSRPFKNVDDLINCFDDNAIGKKTLEYIYLSSTQHS